ncbi:MAG TPA: P-II family nitrogen regulator [Treponemataceae bacterium]|nr:P-II family nitrogen regulator [Treponemataceae bacterium]
MYEIICIVTIVERGKAENIVKEAKEAGATGATIFYGRGTGDKEIKKLLNIHVESSKEIILILGEKEKYKKIMKSIVHAGNLKTPGAGIVFSLPIMDLIGLKHREFLDELENSK